MYTYAIILETTNRKRYYGLYKKFSYVLLMFVGAVEGRQKVGGDETYFKEKGGGLSYKM